MLEFFMPIWNIFWPFGIIYGPLVLFVVIWNICPNFECLTKKNLATLMQGCHRVYFHTKNPNSGIFWVALELKM
jgi:hypothetical protein